MSMGVQYEAVMLSLRNTHKVGTAALSLIFTTHVRLTTDKNWTLYPNHVIQIPVLHTDSGKNANKARRRH